MTASDPSELVANLSHSLAVPVNVTKPSTVMTDDCYDRIHYRIKHEFKAQRSSGWVGAASVFAGIAASAFLAWLVLPRNVQNLPPAAKPVLLVIAIAALVACGLCALAYRGSRQSVDSIAEDICREMETYSYKATASAEPNSGADNPIS